MLGGSGGFPGTSLPTLGPPPWDTQPGAWMHPTSSESPREKTGKKAEAMQDQGLGAARESHSHRFTPTSPYTRGTQGPRTALSVLQNCLVSTCIRLPTTTALFCSTSLWYLWVVLCGPFSSAPEGQRGSGLRAVARRGKLVRAECVPHLCSSCPEMGKALD